MTNSPYTNSPSNVSFETNFNVSFKTNFNAGQATSAAETKQIVVKEIRAKWGKFSEDDLSSLKNKDDLVTQRAAKYGLEKSLAKRRRRPHGWPSVLIPRLRIPRQPQQPTSQRLRCARQRIEGLD